MLSPFLTRSFLPREPSRRTGGRAVFTSPKPLARGAGLLSAKITAQDCTPVGNLRLLTARVRLGPEGPRRASGSRPDLFGPQKFCVLARRRFQPGQIGPPGPARISFRLAKPTQAASATKASLSLDTTFGRRINLLCQ